MVALQLATAHAVLAATSAWWVGRARVIRGYADAGDVSPVFQRAACTLCPALCVAAVLLPSKAWPYRGDDLVLWVAALVVTAACTAASFWETWRPG